MSEERVFIERVGRERTGSRKFITTEGFTKVDIDEREKTLRTMIWRPLASANVATNPPILGIENLKP